MGNACVRSETDNGDFDVFTAMRKFTPETFATITDHWDIVKQDIANIGTATFVL